MRTLLALGAALCLAAAALPARADGPGDLQARARSLQLADDPAWADLLQYEPHPLTRRLRSLADDPGFFNAPDGARSPAAELDATLARLFEPARPDAPDSHPQCRFPARFHWLKSRLPDYDYDRHIGGAMYLFLRGSSSATQGMYLERPPKALMDELDRLFRAEVPA